MLCCTSNYVTNNETEKQETVRLFGFPENNIVRERWIKSLPNTNFVYTESKQLCGKHWPDDYTCKVVNRNQSKAPDVTPTVFEGVPPWCGPIQPPKRGESLNSPGCFISVQ